MPADPNLARFDHLVVVVFENRSFDALLGYLYEDDAPSRFVGRGEPVFRGVAGRMLANPDSHERMVPVEKAPWESPADMCQPDPDPGEIYDPNVNRQIYGTQALPPVLPDPAPMDGFVRDYEHVLGGSAPYEAYRKIMRCFPPEATPVTSGLARAFAVSDEWFASVPSQTFCNRSFLHSGQSHGWVQNSDYVKWLRRNDAPTMFDRLTKKLGSDADWRIYWDREDVVSVTNLIHPGLDRLEYAGRFRPMCEFADDCRAGTLPAYTFIQPRLIVNHNDMHPPVPINPFVHSSILAGEVLLNDVYEAVRNGKHWTRTLLVVLFDEHGGTYDHWPPPLGATPPGPDHVSPDGFRFDRFGVRVPAIFVSPWIPERTVIRAPDAVPFDHTSVLRTLSVRFGLEPLTDRDRNAPAFAAVLGLRNDPDRDTPTLKPRPYDPLPFERAGRSVLSSLQRDVLRLAAAAHGLETRGVETVGHALDRLRGALGRP